MFGPRKHVLEPVMSGDYYESDKIVVSELLVTD